jgi:hypothetical protein
MEVVVDIMGDIVQSEICLEEFMIDCMAYFTVDIVVVRREVQLVMHPEARTAQSDTLLLAALLPAADMVQPVPAMDRWDPLVQAMVRLDSVMAQADRQATVRSG